VTLSLLIKATALLVVVLIAVRAAQRARASVQHAMLAATFVALATLPLATAWLPAWELPVLPPSAVLAVSQGITHDRSGVRAGSGMARPIEGAEPRVTAGPARSVGNSAVESIVLATWLAGTVCVLLTLAVSLLRLQRLRRAGLPCLETQRHLRALARSAGIGRPVDLVVHEDVGAPITYGILRPAIVLPPDAQHWPDAAMTRALVHELEHVKRRDWAVQMIARVVCALYWFHPLVWMA
jgi:beta-lactamase regulating signal transducer with metallopeptidase domain